MKNILVYINPSKDFVGTNMARFRDNTIMVKIQIDNSLSLGWEPCDILLYTNFDYEYRGVKSIVLPDKLYCSFRPLSTKTLTVYYLLEQNLLPDDNLYWVHDFDAFQLESLNPDEVDLGQCDMGLSDYGYRSKWSMGSIFFKKSAKDVFGIIADTIYQYQTEDERALTHLTRHRIGNLSERVKKLNITYNFGMRQIKHNWDIADHPLKVIHFHPGYNLRDLGLEASPLDMFMYGQNDIKKPIMTSRLIKIFNQHGIT